MTTSFPDSGGAMTSRTLSTALLSLIAPLGRSGLHE
jgi:hypothetical protein